MLFARGFVMQSPFESAALDADIGVARIIRHDDHDVWLVSGGGGLRMKTGKCHKDEEYRL